MANKDYDYGRILYVDMETEERANRLMTLLQNCTQFGFMAVSLRYYETLVSYSDSRTSSELNMEEKALADISPGLVKMSIGYSGNLEQNWRQQICNHHAHLRLVAEVTITFLKPQ